MLFVAFFQQNLCFLTFLLKTENKPLRRRCCSRNRQGAIHRTVLCVRPVDCNAVDHAKTCSTEFLQYPRSEAWDSAVCTAHAERQRKLQKILEQVGVVGGSFAVYLFWPHRRLDLSNMGLLQKEHAQP